MICDNTDHKGKKSVKLYHIKLSREFEGDECDWCEKCIATDWNMVSVKSRKELIKQWRKEDEE